MKRSVAASMLAIILVLSGLSGLVGCERKSADDNTTSVTGIDIDSGNIHSNTGLEVSKKLNESNGKYVNLYVENNGSNSVVATINGQNKRTFDAGEKGHIYLEVRQTFWGGDRDYMFKAVPGANGGSINIHYEIAQRLL